MSLPGVSSGHRDIAFDRLLVSQPGNGPDKVGTQDTSLSHSLRLPTSWGQRTKPLQRQEALVLGKLEASGLRPGMSCAQTECFTADSAPDLN